MKVSLRKANALQLLINEQINAPITGSVTVSKFDNPIAVVNEAASQLLDDISRKFDLIGVLYAIRVRVAEAGQIAGVANLLTNQAFLSKREAFLRQLASTKLLAATKESLQAQLEDIKKTDGTAFSRSTSFSAGLLTKEGVDGFKKELVTIRKEKQKLSDKLLHLNVNTEIELLQHEVELLQKYEII